MPPSDPVQAAHDRATPPLRAWLAAAKSYAYTGQPALTEVERRGAEAQRTWDELLAVAEAQPSEGGRPH